MSEPETIMFSCIRVQQPIGEFYIGAIDSADLVKISYADRRRIIEGERRIEAISGIQRPLSPKRVNELKKYVNNVDACFPTGIILAIDEENAVFDESTSMMAVKYADDIAQIIDGQHRIEGLAGYQGKRFEMNVTIFISMDVEDQAIVFSTINLKQTPVSNSLVYDLFEYARTRSPEKTCHNIARLLNQRDDSPFHQRIMILGLATGKPNETLTQAAFIDPLLKLITTDAMSDRDTLKRGKKLEEIDDGKIRTRKLVFRNMFVREEDAAIAKVLWNYFSAVEKRWPRAWSLKQAGLILNRTTGYRALMRFLPVLLLSLDYLNEVPDQKRFEELFGRVKLSDDDFTPERFKPGTSGQSELFHELERQTKLTEETIWPSGRPKTKK